MNHELFEICSSAINPVSRHRLVLLVVGLHTLSDFFHNFRSIYGTLCFEIVAFCIIFFSYYDDLDND